MLLFLNFPGFNATFTNLHTNGRLGPMSVYNLYKGQDHDGKVKISSTFRGIQQWTVPVAGQFKIEAVGAAGGYDNYQNSSQYRGRGAKMVGTFNLLQGEMIQILVGQEGKIRSHGTSSGGGGGTFVVRGSNTPLIVAGGGGGLKTVQSRHQGCDANTSTSGNPGHNSAWSGGRNGDGGKTGSQNDGPSGENNENNYFYLTQWKVSCYRILLI